MAVRDGQIVGVAQVMVRERLWCLSLITVKPDAQSGGAGHALMQSALNYGTHADCGLIVASDDSRALRLYGLSGFRLLPTFQADGLIDRAALPRPDRRVREAGLIELEELAPISREVRGAPRTRPSSNSRLPAGASSCASRTGGSPSPSRATAYGSSPPATTRPRQPSYGVRSSSPATPSGRTSAGLPAPRTGRSTYCSAPGCSSAPRARWPYAAHPARYGRSSRARRSPDKRSRRRALVPRPTSSWPRSRPDRWRPSPASRSVSRPRPGNRLGAAGNRAQRHGDARAGLDHGRIEDDCRGAVVVTTEGERVGQRELRRARAVPDRERAVGAVLGGDPDLNRGRRATPPARIELGLIVSL